MRKPVYRSPFLAFTIAAYLFSWTAWILALQLPNAAVSNGLFYLAGFGPLVGAIAVLQWQGRSWRRWLVSLFKWRVHPAWYLFALGFPILLVGLVSLIYVGLGGQLDRALLPGRLWAYLPTLLGLALIGGGNEELGWRGFALPTLQRRYRPVVATGLLGLVWACWHLPLLATHPAVVQNEPVPHILLVTGITLISIATHAFWYTWLLNRTGSVLLCILLHASYNAANGLLLLIPAEELQGDRYLLILGLMTAVLMASVAGLLVVTRGRLGAGNHQPLKMKQIRLNDG